MIAGRTPCSQEPWPCHPNSLNTPWLCWVAKEVHGGFLRSHHMKSHGPEIPPSGGLVWENYRRSSKYGDFPHQRVSQLSESNGTLEQTIGWQRGVNYTSMMSRRGSPSLFCWNLFRVETSFGGPLLMMPNLTSCLHNLKISVDKINRVSLVFAAAAAAAPAAAVAGGLVGVFCCCCCCCCCVVVVVVVVAVVVVLVVVVVVVAVGIAVAAAAAAGGDGGVVVGCWLLVVGC